MSHARDRYCPCCGTEFSLYSGRKISFTETTRTSVRIAERRVKMVRDARRFVGAVSALLIVASGVFAALIDLGWLIALGFVLVAGPVIWFMIRDEEMDKQDEVDRLNDVLLRELTRELEA